MALVVEEPGAVVPLGEACEDAVLVLKDSLVDLAGDADVEGAGGAAHDVRVAGLHSGMSLMHARALVTGRCVRLLLEGRARGPSTARLTPLRSG